jgi:tetratricopeptide (TPR) repeat protein
MSLLGKLFGGKPEPEKPSSPAVSPPSDPAKDKNLIRVFDKYGRQMLVTREQWRQNVLPGTLQTNWNNPDLLYDIIVGSLNDGFRADVVDAARQLHKIDPQPARGACVWGIVLMEEGRLDEAEKVFRDFIRRHGEEGAILTNLAKVFARRKENTKAEETLWHALEVDPNQENGMGWYEVIHRERGGEGASLEALRRIAAIPASWRAQLWLARSSLKSRHLEQALAFYRESLSRAGRPVPADLLMQMSGDLGQQAHLPELLELTEPYFDAQVHGLRVGNNLIKAHLELGQIEAAQKILNQLYALQRLDWKETLSFWDTEIAKAKIAASNVEGRSPLAMAMLTIEGLVWLRPSSPATELFPTKPTGGVIVAFLGSTAEIATNSKRAEQQLSNAEGRMSRALPLFLAEQVDFGSDARVQTLIPWIAEESGAFVLSGVSWSDGNAAGYARQGELKSDYVVVTHLKTQIEPWIVELRLIRTLDEKCLANLTASFSSASPQETVPGLAQRLLALLSEHAEVDARSSPPVYQVPQGPNFPYYLLRLEQLLAVRCAAMEGRTRGSVSGEREIVEGNLHLCLACPENVVTRVLLAQTVSTMKKVRPDILGEFRDKLMLLQKEKALPEPAQSVIQRMFNEVLAT